MQGKIIKGIAGLYYVQAENESQYECKAKGIFRKDHKKPLVGDEVTIEVLDEEEKKGSITELLPRRSELFRPAVANIDQAVIVFACREPEPNFNLLDRFYGRNAARINRWWGRSRKSEMYRLFFVLQRLIWRQQNLKKRFK